MKAILTETTLRSTNKSVDLFHISVEEHGCAVHTVQEMRNTKISLYESKLQNKLEEEKTPKNKQTKETAFKVRTDHKNNQENSS